MRTSVLSSLLLGMGIMTAVADETRPKLSQSAQEALARIRVSDTQAAIDAIEQIADERARSRLFAELSNHLYWQDRDLESVVLISRGGIHSLLRTVRDVERDNPALARELKFSAQAMAYNLASFCWAGWNEAGIATTATTDRVGLDAAKLNLRLVLELKKDGDGPTNSHWMVGAQWLSQRAYRQARDEFVQATQAAEAAGNDGLKQMCIGYRALAEELASPDSAEVRENFDKAINNLRQHNSKDATFFADQLQTARQVFTGRAESEPRPSTEDAR